MNRLISAILVLAAAAVSSGANATYIGGTDKTSVKGEPWCLCRYSSPKTESPPDQWHHGTCSAFTCGKGEIRRAPEGGPAKSAGNAVDISNIGNAEPEGNPNATPSAAVPRVVPAMGRVSPATQKGAGSPKQPGF